MKVLSRKISEYKKEIFVVFRNVLNIVELAYVDTLYCDEYYKDKLIQDSNYLVTYTQNLEVEEDKQLKEVYDLKTKRRVNITEENEMLFINMYLEGKAFNFRETASVLKGTDFTDEEKVKKLKKYMGSGQDLDDVEIIAEILNQYPELSEIMNYDLHSKGIHELINWVCSNEEKYPKGIILKSIKRRVNCLPHLDERDKNLYLSL